MLMNKQTYTNTIKILFVESGYLKKQIMKQKFLHLSLYSPEPTHFITVWEVALSSDYLEDTVQ